MNVHAPKRTWFRFSLRTLFVLMTLACVWVAYQVHWIRQRRAALQLHMDGSRMEWLAHLKVDSEGPAPVSLRLFGESGCSRLVAYIYPDSPPDLQGDYSRLQKLFPEGDVLMVVTDRGSITDRELSAREGQ